MGEVHLRALSANTHADVRAIVDPNEDRLRYLQRTYEIPSTYPDVPDLLKSEDLDGVIIATPDHLHREPVELAASAGAHILHEKPIATNLADAERIVEVTQQHNVKLMLGFILRFVFPYQELNRRIAGGELGIPTMAYAKRMARAQEARRIAGRCTVNEYLAVHDIDAILWNMGTDVESVYASCGGLALDAQGLNTPDYYWTMIRFRSGATATALSHWAMPDTFPSRPESELLITGTEGSIHLHLDGKRLQLSTSEHFEQPDVAYGFGVEDGGAFRTEDEHFTTCILNDTQPLVDGIDDLNALKVVIAAERSIREDRPIRVELEQST